MLESVKKMKDLHFYVLLALLVAVESLLVLASVLPPMSESNPVHTLFLLLRLLSFIAFGFVLVGKPLREVALKGGLMALAGAIVEIVLLFVGRAIGKSLLGIAIPSETMLYITLLITVVANVILGAILVSLSAWLFKVLRPKADEKTKIKKRKR